MTVAKVWNGTTWEAIAGGVSQSQFDALNARITALEPAAPRLLAFQKTVGANNAYKAAASSGNFVSVNAAGTVPLQITYTPTVPVWWDVRVHLGLVQKTDAAYHYAQVTLNLTPADADGDGGTTQTITQHSQVQQFEGYAPHGLFKLAAGVAYTAYAGFAYSGGTWQYHQNINMMQITGRVYAR